MRITKFPDKCDPNKIMMDTIIKEIVYVHAVERIDFVQLKTN